MKTRKLEIDIDVIYTLSDEVWAATSNDIRGFFLQSDGFANFVKDLSKYGPEMLRLNHGYTEEQLRKVMFHCHVTYEVEQESVASTPHPAYKVKELKLAVA